MGSNRYYNKKGIAYYNGKWVRASDVCISPFSQTLHYGIGVFDGIRSYNTPNGTRTFMAKEHYARMIKAAAGMGITLNYTPEELTRITYELLEKNGLSEAYIRPLVFLGEDLSLKLSKDVNILIMGWQWERLLGDNLLRVKTASSCRPSPRAVRVDAKVIGNFAYSIRATDEVRKLGYDNALLLDPYGNVAEGPGTNFFYEKNGVLYTPQKGNIFPGITRKVIIKIATDMEFTVVEKVVTPDELEDIDGAFFTGTASEIAGIESIDDRKVNLDWDETIGYTLFKAFKQRVTHSGLGNFELV